MNKVSEEFVAGKHNIGYVYESFKNKFYDEEIVPGKVLISQKLPRDMTDGEIFKEFKIEECSLGDILTTLDAATEEMKDGNWNIFYVGSHVVHVHWSSACGGWHVGGWYRGDDMWFEGFRVFTPATASAVLDFGTSDTLKLENYCSCERCEKCGRKSGRNKLLWKKH